MKNVFLILSLFSVLVNAREYKVVFDCSSADASYIKSRMWLVGKTIDMIEEQGDTAKVALTLHGSCVAMVAKDYDMTVPDEDVQDIKQSQQYLKKLAKRKNVTITACAMSLAHNAIEKEDVLPFVKISKNSFLDTIRYQNDGYALMSFK
ncbi:DsrE family protein [Sulfurimonas hydrogeniphila]|uniref:DsrE family protein n=1 Tax=Sulfurimonas hydrogeniphila TaxID=2509341 RepID=UPI00125F1BEA|nr:DsrE family protein [Sulfurimonas hydrogeniphila]